MAVSNFKKGIIVATTISAAIMELIDTSIVNVALTQISGNLGATVEDTSWVITAYAIANVIIIPLTGFLAKYFGRKNYYIASIIIFTIASFFCSNADSLWVLVFWRFIQGIGGGALLSTSQSILFDTFSLEQRAMASGIFGMGIVLGPTLGPTLGGIIVEYYTWPLIFDINIPFGIVAVLLAYNFIDKKPEEYLIDKKSIDIDFMGIIFLVMGIGSLQYVLERGEHEDWFDSKTIILLTATATIGLVGFIYRQLTIATPIINLKVLKSRNLVASNILTFVCGFGLFGSVFIFPVMVQRIMGYSPTEAGFAIVPGALIAILIMPIIGKRMGSGTPPIVFVVIGFISFILHGYLSSLANPDAGRAWFIVPQIFRGIGTACLTVPLINQAAVGLAPKDLAYGISLTNMLRQLGGAFGIAVMNTYIAQRYMLHRTDLLSNMLPDDPQLIERFNLIQQGVVSRGVNEYASTETTQKLLDLTVTKQAYLQAYLDGFILISLFFIATVPFLFLLQTKKTDAATRAKVAAEAH
jgi:DHA2 family multidrug resistance protein